MSTIISQLSHYQKAVPTSKKQWWPIKRLFWPIKRKWSKSKKNDSCPKWPKTKNKNDGIWNDLKRTDSCPFFHQKAVPSAILPSKSHSHHCFSIKIVHFQSALPIWLATLPDKLFHWSIYSFFPSPPTQKFYICAYSSNTDINFIIVPFGSVKGLLTWTASSSPSSSFPGHPAASLQASSNLERQKSWRFSFFFFFLSRKNHTPNKIKIHLAVNYKMYVIWSILKNCIFTFD